MSLSRPVKFPLLKLPFLCIGCLIKNCDVLDIIIFALISNRTRRIVKSLNIPLIINKIILSDVKWIELHNFSKKWLFEKSKWESVIPKYNNLGKYSLVLQENATPLYSGRTNNVLNSCTVGTVITALKMAMEFLDEVFKCSVEKIHISVDNFPEPGEIGVKSSENLHITFQEQQPFGHDYIQKLKSLFENLEVTGTCYFSAKNTEIDFYCDPKLFKCKKSGVSPVFS